MIETQTQAAIEADPKEFTTFLARPEAERRAIVQRCRDDFPAHAIEECIRKLEAVLVAHRSEIGGYEAAVHLFDDALGATWILKKTLAEKGVEVGLLAPAFREAF